VSGFLLDTNILSETRRPRPDAKVLAFLKSKPASELFVSSVAFAEIRFGIEMISEPARRAELTDWFEFRLRPEFGERILPVSEDVMVRWRMLVEDGRRIGHTFSQPDLIIAATALQFGLTLVTRNTEDFVKTRVALINPWIDQGA